MDFNIDWVYFFEYVYLFPISYLQNILIYLNAYNLAFVIDVF